ncbi:hypothetical protein BpOF4_14765 [Alkalihalophilus pseudofirmus OF4]|uniref:Uncharacterized protein n=1 Tax=Alkalihalophilus pseudofirmus (strain ATCC BAA-2126 / JCM 17055 / OF4) TaxID=398511 RepID=D3FZD3_ALKPO|nr:hypothetical protein [Alkalihalophilus pseudofirmus]ADC51002.1 hypothetical protein BpOF4_14765 [Alkalihalophilus pseudofirmus OF4]
MTSIEAPFYPAGQGAAAGQKSEMIRLDMRRLEVRQKEAHFASFGKVKAPII